MDDFPGFFIFLLLIATALSIWALFLVSRHSEKLEALHWRIAKLEGRLEVFLANSRAKPVEQKSEPISLVAPPTTPSTQPEMPSVPIAPVVPPVVPPTEPTPTPVPPPPPVSSIFPLSPSAPISPPPILPPTAPAQAYTPAAKADFNWEQFLGAKLIAWIGGLALFLGLVYLTIESLKRGWISPWLRATTGAFVGFCLIGVGTKFRNSVYRISAQTLVGTGVVTLYAVVYACRGFYKFPLFSPTLSFILLVGITVGAFALAGLMRAQVVAVLGLLAGFLSPVLIRTGQDSPFLLFSFLALLTIGVLAVSGRFQWRWLSPLAGFGFVLLFLGWFGKYGLTASHSIYLEWPFMLVPMGVALLFPGLHWLGNVFVQEKNATSSNMAATSLALAIFALSLSTSWLFGDASQDAIGVVFAYIFATGVLSLVVALRHKPLGAALPVFSGITALLLGAWTISKFQVNDLWLTMGVFAVYMILYGLVPMFLQRRQRLTVPPVTAPLVVFTGLGLAMIAILTAPLPALLSGILVLLLTALALGIAVMLRQIVALHIAAVLSFICFGAALVKVKTGVGLGLDLEILLLFICLFALGFVVLTTWLWRAGGALENEGEMQKRSFGIGSCVMPFALLLLVVGRGDLPEPTAPFAAMVALGCLLAWTANWLRVPALLIGGLAGTLVVEYVWFFQHVRNVSLGLLTVDVGGEFSRPTVFGWFLCFALLYTVVPFVSWQRWMERKTVWTMAAMALPLHYSLLSAASGWLVPEAVPGLLPALLSVPSILGLVFLLKKSPVDNPMRVPQIARFAGAVLFFVTLIFPVQFKENALTIAWALEAAALCWLLRKIPHRGLCATALGLFALVFLRLTFFSEVLHGDYEKSLPILNSYLYTYGLVAGAFVVAAWQLRSCPVSLIFDRRLVPLLQGAGLFLVFVLVNVEIADYFTAVSATRMNLSVTGRWMDGTDAGWARGMSFTLAWGVFALGMVGAGIWKHLPLLRWAGLGLFGVTLLKLFLADLAGLENIYRVIALIGTALLAIGASLLYQRFLGKEKP